MQQGILTHHKVNLPVEEPARLTNWYVKAGEVIRKGKLLCDYQVVAGGKTMSLKAKHVGTVIELLTEAGSATLQPGYVLYKPIYKQCMLCYRYNARNKYISACSLRCCVFSSIFWQVQCVLSATRPLILAQGVIDCSISARTKKGLVRFA